MTKTTENNTKADAESINPDTALDATNEKSANKTDSKKSSRNNTKKLVLCAILIACSIILNQIKLFHAPFGGAVTPLSMFAATLCGYFCGPKYGLISGFSLGLLNLIFGGYVIHPVQLLLDYILAFTCLGFSGFFRTGKYSLYTGYAISVFARFVMSFLSGWIFFADYAPEGMLPWLYSLLYQGSYIGIEAVITIVILLIPAVHNNIYRLKSQYS